MFINLTPHKVTIQDRVFKPSGVVARCTQVDRQVGEIGGIPIIDRQFGEVTNLPEKEWGTHLIVSNMVRLALPDRADLFSPGDLVRDDDGNIIGCQNLLTNLENKFGCEYCGCEVLFTEVRDEHFLCHFCAIGLDLHELDDGNLPYLKYNWEKMTEVTKQKCRTKFPGVF